MPSLGPRLVVAGTASGVGKTTVATGLMAALRASGTTVASAKVGPDFIDPGYHGLAAGRPGRNLDPWMCGPELVAPLAARAAAGAEVLVVEGVMGLFDGAADGRASSTADVAAALEAPVVLVVDAAAMAQSASALVAGFVDHDPRVQVAGVILNGLGSDSHEAMVRKAIAEGPRPVPVLGALHRDDRLVWRDRHLGLVPVAEQPDEVAASLDRLAALVRDRVDLAAVLTVARAAPTQVVAEPPTPRPVGRARVAVARGRAFTFAYPDNDEALEAAGCELVGFDPTVDEALPEGTDALVVGGGFPEVLASELSANEPLRREVAAHVAAGKATWAECGGLLWLARSLDGHPMVGALAADATTTDRLTLGYRTARTRVATPLGPAGTEVRGHEFHYTRLDPPGDALDLHGRTGAQQEGHATPTLLATYLHVHLAGRPDLAEAFALAATTCPGVRGR